MAIVYDEIGKNSKKTFLLFFMMPTVLATVVASFLLLAALWSNKELNITVDYWDIFISFFVITFGAGIVWMIISYYFGNKMILSSVKASKLEFKDNQKIYRLVENTAIAAGLKTPQIYIIEDESLNAFTTGKDQNNSAIILTTGIINCLDNAELEAVIAHELAHIGNKDVIIQTMLITGAGVFYFVAKNIYNVSKNSQKQSVVGVLVLAMMIFHYLMYPLIKKMILRTREYQADATASLITRNPLALATALEKISADSRVEFLDIHDELSSLCIADPTALKKLFATHPPIEDRIKRLQEMLH